MASSAGRDATQSATDSATTDEFPTHGLLKTQEQMRRFELLRLAFFALKLRKLDGQAENEGAPISKKQAGEREFRRNLLRHVIFQQVLTLTQLDAREQALQIIAACRQ